MNLRSVAIVCDLLEEHWPSMELVADRLLDQLQRDYSDVLSVTEICPSMNRRFTKQGAVGSEQWAGNGVQGADPRAKRFNADRFLNRFWDYPRAVRKIRGDFDLFHLVDHSYAQLLHELPPERTIVTCHDLDTFQCLLNPEREPRSIYFRKMMQRTLSGFRKAAFVTCDSVATRDELLAHDLVPAKRTIVIPNGVHPSCSPQPNAKADAEANEEFRIANFGLRNVEAKSDGIELLHVGSTIPRKRIDVLLRVFARVKELFPTARLVRVGGAFTAEQEALVEKLRLRDSIVVLPHIDREVLAAIYRRAALVLQPSEREGFGLPVVEAMACGTPVVASDLPVLREVGGEAAVYCPMGNVEAWTEQIAELLVERDESRRQKAEGGRQKAEGRRQEADTWTARREAGIVQAAKFSWAEYARKMVEVYQRVLSEQ